MSGDKVYGLIMSKQITIDVPEDLLVGEVGDEAGLGYELRMLAAVKAYELGRLSSGKAAELAGVSRIEFLDRLERYKVFPLQAELEELERDDG